MLEQNRFSQGNFPVLRHDSRFMGILQRNEGRYKRNKQGLRPKGNPSVLDGKVNIPGCGNYSCLHCYFFVALLLFGETAERNYFIILDFRISTGGLYDRQVSLTCNLDVLCVHPALHADTQPAAFFKEVLPGSAFSALSWILVTTLFSLYINNFADFSKCTEA